MRSVEAARGDVSFKFPQDCVIHRDRRGEFRPTVHYPMSDRGEPVIATMIPEPLCEVRKCLLVTEFLSFRPSRFLRDASTLLRK